MDSHETLQETDAPVWPELSADVTVARSVAKAITLDTQKASMDGRVIELSSQVQAVNHRLLDLEKMVGNDARGGNVDELTNLVTSLRAEIDRTNAKCDDLAQQTIATPNETVVVPELVPDERIPGLIDRVSTVEDARLRDTEQLNNLTSYLEQAFHRLDEMSSTVDTLRAEAAADDELDPIRTELRELSASLSTLQGHITDTESSLRSDFANAEVRLDARVDAVEQNLRQQVESVETNLAEQVAMASEHLRVRADETDRSLTIKLAEAGTDVSDAHASLTEARELLEAARENLVERFDESDVLLSGKISAATADMEDRVAVAEQNLAAQVLEATRILTTHESSTEEHLATQVAEARAALTTQVTEAVAELESKIAEISQSPSEESPESQRRHDELAAKVGLLTDTIAELESQGAAEAQRFSALQYEVGRVLDAEPAPTAEQIDERVDTKLGPIAGRLDAADQRFHATDERLDAADERIAATDGRIDDTNERIAESITLLRGLVQESIPEPIDQSVINDRVASLSDHVGQAEERVAEVDDRVGQIDDHVGQIDDRVGQIDDRVGQIDDRVEQIDDRSAEIDRNVESRFTQTEDRISGVEARIDEAHELIGYIQGDDSLDETLSAIGDRVDNVHARVDEAIAPLAATSEQVDLAIAQLAETQTQLSDTRHELTDTINQVTETRARLDQTSALLADTQGLTDDHASRFAQIDERFEELAGSIPAPGTDPSELIAEKLAEQQADHRAQLAQIEASVDERVEAAREALTQQAATTEQSLAEQVSLVEANLVEQVVQTRELLSQQVADAGTSLDDRLGERLQSSEQSFAERLASSESAVTERLDAAEAALAERVRQAEEAREAGFTVDEDDIAAIRESAASAQALAIESQKFTEHLRLLQTDLVKAVQAELTDQANKVASLTSLVANSDARVEYLETTVGAVMSMPQGDLGMASAAPDQAIRLSNIEKSTDDRIRDMDSKVARSLAALVDIVERNNSEIETLRLELQKAQNRVAELEIGLENGLALSGTPPESTPNAATAEGLTVAEILGHAPSKVSDGEWFADKPQPTPEVTGGGAPSRKRSKRGKSRK